MSGHFEIKVRFGNEEPIITRQTGVEYVMGERMDTCTWSSLVRQETAPMESEILRQSR